VQGRAVHIPRVELLTRLERQMAIDIDDEVEQLLDDLVMDTLDELDRAADSCRLERTTSPVIQC